MFLHKLRKIESHKADSNRRKREYLADTAGIRADRIVVHKPCTARQKDNPADKRRVTASVGDSREYLRRAAEKALRSCPRENSEQSEQRTENRPCRNSAFLFFDKPRENDVSHASEYIHRRAGVRSEHYVLHGKKSFVRRPEKHKLFVLLALKRQYACDYSDYSHSLQDYFKYRFRFSEFKHKNTVPFAVCAASRRLTYNTAKEAECQ